MAYFEMTGGNDDIPAEVRQFILAKIDSVSQLEALLLIAERSAESWTQERLAAALYVDQHAAQSIVSDLERKGWIKRVDHGFTYDCAWDTEGILPKLSHTYRTRLVAVATLIHSNVSSAVRDFARAFDLKKE